MVVYMPTGVDSLQAILIKCIKLKQKYYGRRENIKCHAAWSCRQIAK